MMAGAVILSPSAYSHHSAESALSHCMTHLKVLLNEIPSFAQALHDGFVPQDVLLA